MLFRMVPKLILLLNRVLMSFRAVLFQMVSKPVEISESSSTCFRAVRLLC
ncbi:hypothetical protein SaSA201_0798 [Streptococcus agalactiae]|nr:hypothetical protein SaSA16_0793 [Streptococcus agalactiae]AUO96818.1 hypothetical protein SaSA81_0793 [Streptococcus agalactiae]AUP09663.1 hypothetical protein SaSA184_0799 [Streptococcus agalactiae]AUP12848.1 hypothetical protein SaSA195_0800 [Streptococcus agalactiae]AUP14487.1 hypothetical protein SaSA201_0798 [Streptococcus agalactiae]